MGIQACDSTLLWWDAELDLSYLSSLQMMIKACITISPQHTRAAFAFVVVPRKDHKLCSLVCCL